MAGSAPSRPRPRRGFSGSLWPAGLLCLAALSLARGLAADSQGVSLVFGAPVAPQAGRLARLLALPRARAVFALPDGILPPAEPGGAWGSPALAAALGSYGALSVRWEGKGGDGGDAVAPDEGPRVEADGLPRVLLLENGATLKPLSQGLAAWGWPASALAVRSFKDAEAAPKGLLDPSRWDAVVVESPAGWGDGLGDGPSGPSCMDDATAQALRDYVRRGGTALFVDISQWDVDKLWPGDLDLVNAGPYAVSRLSAAGGPDGTLSLSTEGEVADRVPPGAFSLIGDPAFTFVDGNQGPVYAAWAMPDPDGGPGWVAGLGYHTFDQALSNTLDPTAERLLLNLLLLSGRRRLKGLGGEPQPALVPPTATAVPTHTPVPPTPMPVPTDTSVPPTPTPVPTDTPVPPTPTAVPTDTPIPPTATSISTDTPIPPTPTSIPTDTPIPPTATSVPTRFVPPPAAPIPVRAAAPVAPPPAAVAPPPASPRAPVPAPAPAMYAPRPAYASTPSFRRAPRAAWAWPTATPVPYRPRYRRAWVWPSPTPQARPRPLRRRRSALRRRRREAAPPAPVVVVPTAAPTAEVLTRDGVQADLGCLSTDPEPFGQGGVYLEFCLGRPAWVKAEVLDWSGKVLWRTRYRWTQAGRMQWWYPGTLASGRAAPPGPYAYVVTAYFGPGLFVTREGSMTRGQQP